MARTYFSECKTAQEVKSEYRRLALKYHPDRGGDAKVMAAINKAYKQALERVATDSQKRSGNGTFENLDDGYMAIINTVIAMDGVELELCGLWLWLSGNTKPHKEAIKKLGFKWASKKKKWYWRPEWYQRRGNRKEWDMTDIRAKYGSAIIEGQEDATRRIEQKALTRYTDGRKVWSKIRQTAKGRQYIRRGGCRYYFDDCMAIMD